MITLATLSTTSSQEVFDTVAKHLLTQKSKSVMDFHGIPSCAYRGENGTKCAAGCLISDEEYNAAWEQSSWHVLNMAGSVPTHHLLLIKHLQTVHDSMGVERWKSGLSNVAHMHYLDDTVLDSF